MSDKIALIDLIDLIIGKRTFLVSDMKTFLNEYYKIAPENRHLYEIIREEYPCRAYFDLGIIYSYLLFLIFY